MFRSILLRMCVVAGALLADCAAAGADVIFDNGEPSGLNGWASDATCNQRIVDNFALAEGANVLTDIHWSGTYWQPGPLPDMAEFTFTIFTSATTAFIPDSVVWQSTAAVARQETELHMWFGGQEDYPENIMDVFDYDYALDVPLALNAKQTYFLSILAESSGSDEVWWYWCQSGNGRNAINTGTGWHDHYCEMAFLLTGGAGGVVPDPPEPPGSEVVPEPATLGLVGLGLVGLVVRRRGKK